MLQNITLGQYFPGCSVIHNLDPRTKFLALPVLIILITINEHPGLLGFQYLFLGFLAVISRIPAGHFFGHLKPFLLLVLITLFLHAFMTGGNTLFEFPIIGLTVSREGFESGLFFGLRLFLLIGFSLLMMFTTAPTDLTDGFERMLRPFSRIGLPADRVALMFGIAFRFIPILFEEADRIQKAQMARGADYSGSLISRIRSVSAVVIPLFISVFNRANALALALEARGFNRRGEKTHFRELRMGLNDLAAFAVLALILIGTNLHATF